MPLLAIFLLSLFLPQSHGNLPAAERTVNRWVDIAAFVAPPCPCFGNSGRGILRGPGMSNIDISLVREFHFNERFRLQVRTEAFNLFNHPNLGLPGFNIGTPGVGIIGTAVSPERQIQAATRLYFSSEVLPLADEK